MNQLKFRTFTLLVSSVMALSMMMVMPSLTNVFGTSDIVIVNQVACASSNGSCCPYKKAVCGLNGQNYNDKHYSDGSCGGTEGQDCNTPE